jgi:hypothetical protein
MVLVEMGMMYTPKKQNWNSLSELRDFLIKETTEKIVLFNGHQLVTETTVYGLAFGKLLINPKQKKVVGYEKGTTFLNRKPIYEKEVKRESKSTKGRSDGTTADKERMGTHGRSDHAKPNGKKASEVCATKVPKKVSKPKKSPK